MATGKSVKTEGKKTSSAGRRPRRVSRSASSGKKMQASISGNLPSIAVSRKYRKIIFTLAVLAVFILGIKFWYTSIYTSPERVFWGMVDNNLSTSGFTKETTQPVCVPNAQSTNIIQTTFTPTLAIRCITHIEQGIIKLTIESIGTLDADYERYSNVLTTGDNSKVDKYSKIYDLWLKNNGQEAGKPDLYGQLLNSPVLFGYLSKEKKDSVTQDLKQVYIVDYKKLTKRSEKLRPVYVYFVTVPLKKFAVAEKKYAELMSLPNANQIKPDTYDENAKVNVKLTVDALSRHLKEIEFQNVSEKYSGYGISAVIKVPEKTVPLSELQRAFQSISK